MSGQNYGSRRIQCALLAENIAIGRYKVRRIMRQQGLKTTWTRAFKRTTDSQHTTTHFAENIHFHLQDQTETACNLSAILQEPSPEKHLYVCGSTGFMQYVMNAATTEGWQSSELHQEHFVAQNLSQHDDQAFTIEILGSEQKIEVSTQQTAMQALIENGFDIPISCEQGICGTCITRVVSGIPDHRDLFMTDEEHALNDQFTPCCSRAKSKILVLDLS